jgi:hypothetical protein
VTSTLEVAPAATSTAIDALPSSIPLGTPIDVAAHVAVTAPGQGEPAGTVEIRDDDGGICSYEIALATSCTLTPAHAGDRTISARYLGDAEFGASKSVAAAVTVVGADSVSLSVSDSSDYARYGGTNVYLVSIDNTTSSDAVGLALAGGTADGLDTAAGEWCEFDESAECPAPVVGPFATGGLVVAAHATRTWAVTIPVRADAPGATVGYAVTLGGGPMPAPVTRADTDWLVLFRNGFE